MDVDYFPVSNCRIEAAPIAPLIRYIFAIIIGADNLFLPVLRPPRFYLHLCRDAGRASISQEPQNLGRYQYHPAFAK